MLKNSLAGFILRRSISAVIVVFVVVSITAVALYSFNTQRCPAIRAEVLQNIEKEIAEKHMIFPSEDARQNYIQQRMDTELKARGLEYCIS